MKATDKRKQIYIGRLHLVSTITTANSKVMAGLAGALDDENPTYAYIIYLQMV